MSLFGSLSLSDIGGIASGVGALASAGLGYLGAQEQVGAAKDAQRASERAYARTRADQAPFLRVGTDAVNRLSDIYLTGKTPFTAAPGYDFRVDEGRKALERSASARGMLGSGATGRALIDYGQSAATDEYNQGFNRLSSLAGYGPTAAASTGTAAQNLAINIGDASARAGEARRSGYESVGNAITGLGSNLVTLAALDRYGRPPTAAPTITRRSLGAYYP